MSSAKSSSPIPQHPKPKDYVTLVFNSRQLAERAAGVIDLADIIDSSPMMAEVTVKAGAFGKACADLRADGFFGVSIRF